MIITAKFNSRCMSCRGEIKTGSKIDWIPGVGARHAECEPIPTCPLCNQIHNPLKSWTLCEAEQEDWDPNDFHDY